ncbi:MAG: TlpA family protein disulfide reductase [Desulfomonile sp.]|nr:TlpA family protein disulfide reductase [Desulfomonile sp.]
MMRFDLSALIMVFLLAVAAAPTVPLGAVAAGSPPTEDFQLFKNLPPAGDFDMQTMDGAPLSLTQLKGRVVLMNFWRSNCPYCEQEKQHLRKMLRMLNRPDVTVLSVNLWDTPEWVRRYARANGNDFLIASRAGDKQSAVDNVVRGRLLGYFVVNSDNEAVFEVKGFPTTYVIDGEGRVVAVHHGMARWDSPSISRWVAGLAPAIKDTETTRVERNDERLPEWLDRLLGSPIAVAAQTQRARGPRLTGRPAEELGGAHSGSSGSARWGRDFGVSPTR